MTSPTPPPNTGDTAATQLVTDEGAQNIRLASTGEPKPDDDFAQIAGSWRLPKEDGGA